MSTWLDLLHRDPLPWLLDESAPAVRHLALRQLLDRPEEDDDVVAAQGAGMRSVPIAAFLAAQAAGRTATPTRAR